MNYNLDSYSEALQMDSFNMEREITGLEEIMTSEKVSIPNQTYYNECCTDETEKQSKELLRKAREDRTSIHESHPLQQPMQHSGEGVVLSSQSLRGKTFTSRFSINSKI